MAGGYHLFTLQNPPIQATSELKLCLFTIFFLALASHAGNGPSTFPKHSSSTAN